MRITAILILGIFVFTGCQNSPEPKLTMLPAVSAPSSGEPNLFTSEDGTVYLTYIHTSEDSSFLKYTTLKDGSWSAPKTISQGNDWFVNWADFPALAAQSEDYLMAHFLQKSSQGTYSYDVMTTHSSDNGNTWSTPKVLHDDGKNAEHGFVSILPYQDQYFITWLDGRNTGGGDHSDHHASSGSMTLRAALVSKEGAKNDEWELDNKVCDCCQTSAAITDNGPVVVYRNRSDDEIRDMHIVRMVDGAWTKPQPIHNDQWKIAGCPVNGPSISAVGNNLAIAWFSSAQGAPEVKVIFSEDGGSTFGAAHLISDKNTVGRVDIEMLDKNRAAVSWMQDGNIMMTTLDKHGEMNPPVNIGQSSEARSSGFPRMTKYENSLILAWTNDSTKIINTAILDRF